MADDIAQVIEKTRVDAKSLEEVVNGNDSKQVTTRLGESYPSIKKAIKLMTQSGVGFTPFETKALMTASAIANGGYAIVTNDTAANSGLYLKKSGAWSKVAWDIDERTKNYTDAQVSSVISTASSANAKAVAAEQKAVSAEQIATAAKSTADAIVYSDNNRAGDAAALFADAIVGEPDALTLSNNLVVSTVNGIGKTLVVKNKAGYIAARKATAFYEEHNYRAYFSVKRIKNPLDPLNDTVQTGVEWLAFDKTAIQHKAIENIALKVADGIVDRFYDLVAPTGAVYVRPWVRVYGEDSETAIIYLDVRDVTESKELDIVIEADISAAKAEAISAAAIDATSKADAAKDEAISAAAIDAQTKADDAKAKAIATSTDLIAGVSASKADKVSPIFSGTPTAPTASVENTNTQIANTTFAFLMQHGQKIVPITGGNTTLLDGDTRYPTLVFTGLLQEDTTVTVPSLGGPRNWTIRNATTGSYALTLTGPNNSLVLPSGMSKVYSNATSLFILGAEKAPIDSPLFVGKPRANTANLELIDNQIANTTFAFSMQHGQKIIPVTGGVTLTDGNTRYPIIVFTGSNDTVTVPTLGGPRNWMIRNATSGDLTLKATGNSVLLPLGISIVYCNGTSVYLLTPSSGTAPVVEPKPLKTLNATLTSKSPKNIVVSMSRDRTRGWGYASNTLDETTDDGLTWTNLYTFAGMSVEVVRELGDGELLVVTTDGATYRTVWKTQGYGTGDITMVECFKGHAPAVKFASAWSVFIQDNIVLVSDYGPKAGFTWGSGSEVIAEGDNARYSRMSLDNGKTWQTVFDLNAWLTANDYATTGCHLHGVAYDKWWDRLWITFGDNAYGIGGTVFSDDLGATWHWANEGKADKDNPALAPEGSACQVVGILPMKDCILFGTDTSPNGILKISRNQGKKTSKYKMEIGFKINEDAPSHLCQGIWQFSDDHPAFFAFSSEFKSSPSCIIATWDGINFKKVWQDSINNPSGMGLRSVVGPTIRGNLIAAHNDTRVSGLWSEVKGKAPIY